MLLPDYVTPRSGIRSFFFLVFELDFYAGVLAVLKGYMKFSLELNSILIEIGIRIRLSYSLFLTMYMYLICYNLSPLGILNVLKCITISMNNLLKKSNQLISIVSHQSIKSIVRVYMEYQIFFKNIKLS